MNISNHFSSIITRDDSHERTTQIKKSVKFLSLSPQEIVVIGDRIHDINSAKQVGCSAILSNKNKLDSFNESLVISELLELKKINFSKNIFYLDKNKKKKREKSFIFFRL